MERGTAPPLFWGRTSGWRACELRVESGTEATDIIRFAQQEQGKPLGIPVFLLDELREKQVAAADVFWVCRSKAHVLRSANWKCGEPERVEFGEQALVLATDDQDEVGYLVLRDCSALDASIIQRFIAYRKAQHAFAIRGTDRPYRTSFSQQEQETLEQAFEAQLLSLLDHLPPARISTSGQVDRRGSKRGLRGLVEDFVLSYLYDHRADIARHEVDRVLSLMESMVDHLDARLALLATEQPLGQLVSGIVFLMIKTLRPEYIDPDVLRMCPQKDIPLIEQAFQLFVDSGLSATYTVEIDPEYTQGEYAISVVEVPALDQWFIPVADLPLVMQRVVSRLQALGPVGQAGYQERLAALAAQGYICLYPDKPGDTRQ